MPTDESESDSESEPEPKPEPTPTVKYLRPKRRDTPRDKDCTWGVLRNAFCGSCGCVSDPNEESVLDDHPSSSSVEYKTRNITPVSAAALRKSVQNLDSTIPEDIEDKKKKWYDVKRWFSRPEKSSSGDLLKVMRIININERQTTKYVSNHTVTAKYTVYNFLPIFLYEQFRRYSNVFFLSMAILQQIPGVSPTGRYITVFPLLFILAVSAIKEIIEDRKRHQSDRESNRRFVKCLRSEEWKSIHSEDVYVGDILRIHDKEFFPADLVILSSSTANGLCFVQTANLDGESNLKMRQALPQTMEMTDTSSLSKFRGSIECQVPNRRIYDFFGILRTQESNFPLGPHQFLQRGAALSNTKWIVGITVYTGNETKLIKSYASAPLKNSAVDRLLNTQFCSLFGVYLLVALSSAALNLYWSEKVLISQWYLGLSKHLDFRTVFYSCISFLILYNNMIPISLQVTVEMVHFFQAIFINSDLEMYYPETNTPAQARSSNLNEELGMVQYILTDKTGTLTCNIMKFIKCSIGGIKYDIESENVEQSESELVRALHENGDSESTLLDFMHVITLCHTVVTEEKEDGTIVYHATNPEDQSIITGAAACGYKFFQRKGNFLDIIELDRQERYTLLQTIDYNSNRKRMSTIIRMPDGKIKLFCKGADSIILARLDRNIDRDYYAVTMKHLDEFSKLGLRTLCCAVAEITEEQFSEWIVEYQNAQTLVNEREERMESLADQIEQNLILLGVTAIEDKLQDGVPETITFLKAAGIRVWMLTGDKRETAINIAYSAGLLDSSLRLFIIEEENVKNTYITLSTQLQKYKRLSKAALVIDGKTLYYALDARVYKLFKSICLKCRVVVCCRMSPMQKGKLTDLVKSTGACTLAIGDGANDVSMIRKANVGVGISGFEGYQAASASDYSIGQFRFLKRLLFVHGTWNFHRITTLTLYSFYKNIILSIMLMWFSFANAWSAQILFDRWVIAGHNLIFTSLPPLAIGIFDKVVSAETLLKYPRIYSRAQNNKLFNVGIFWVWMLNAILHSLLLFWIPYMFFFQNDVAFPTGHSLNLSLHGTMVYTVAVTVVVFKAGIILHSWNVFTHIAIWGSLTLWMLTIIVYSCFWPVIPAGEDFVYTHVIIFPSCIFWLFVLITVVIILLPDFFLKVFLNRYFLPLNDLSLHAREYKA